MVPEAGAPTEVRYFYIGTGEANKTGDKASDPDKQLAHEIKRRLGEAGFKGEITIIPVDDDDVPENFIQVRFAKGSLD